MKTQLPQELAALESELELRQELVRIHTKHLKLQDELIEALGLIMKLQAENRELRERLADAVYVLEGSCAFPGQSDEELTKRETALMRVLVANKPSEG